jgi:hypothetical protein
LLDGPREMAAFQKPANHCHPRMEQDQLDLTKRQVRRFQSDGSAPWLKLKKS